MQALDALREMTLRGEQVAVMLADYRMPRMNGIEFLEQAMDLFPRARRVLLTAYADTDAAIDAINVVDLDHYLLKPWDPPEEKLYPVVDALLEAWRRADHRPVAGDQVVGHRWSARSYEVRDFLARNQVPYRWYLADEPEGERLLAAAGGRRPQPAGGRSPPSGDALVAPDRRRARRARSACPPRRPRTSTTSSSIGGGPAGLGAAVYGASEGLRTVLVERNATGGQAGQSSRIENYLGFPDGVSGAQLTERARRQASRSSAPSCSPPATSSGWRSTGRPARCGSPTAPPSTRTPSSWRPASSYRQLARPGLDEFTGRGVFYGVGPHRGAGCTGQDVYIVGGANSAGQAAVYLARHARSVTHPGPRRRRWSASMSYYLIQQIADIDNITVRTCTEVVEGPATTTWSS